MFQAYNVLNWSGFNTHNQVYPLGDTPKGEPSRTKDPVQGSAKKEKKKKPSLKPRKLTPKERAQKKKEKAVAMAEAREIIESNGKLRRYRSKGLSTLRLNSVRAVRNLAVYEGYIKSTEVHSDESLNHASEQVQYWSGCVKQFEKALENANNSTPGGITIRRAAAKQLSVVKSKADSGMVLKSSKPQKARYKSPVERAIAKELSGITTRNLKVSKTATKSKVAA